MSASLPTSAFLSIGPAVSPATRARRLAFTLVEMIVVMGIIIIIATLIVPAFTHLRGSSDFTAAAGGIASTLEQARAYAMANNTYVYVGIGEYLVSERSEVSPRTVGTGELVVAVVAARDGTRGYDVNNPSSTWPTYYANGAPLLAIDKLHLYDNIHLTDLSTTSQSPNSNNNDPPTGNMSRPVVALAYELGADSNRSSNSTYAFTTPISWPLGTALGSGQYQFTHVIQFDPQGVARLQFASNADAIAPVMEIYLQPTHGNLLPAVPATSASENMGDQAAITIDCMTGAVRTYRP